MNEDRIFLLRYQVRFFFGHPKKVYFQLFEGATKDFLFDSTQAQYKN